jgi:hypothetical protein
VNDKEQLTPRTIQPSKCPRVAVLYRRASRSANVRVMATPRMTLSDATAPIIIVGAGRSGTTRLSGTLGEHPDVYMINETSFLLPRLWATFHERPDYVRIIRLGQLARETRAEWQATPFWAFWRDVLREDLRTLGPVLADIESAETVRLQRAFGSFFMETLIPPALRKPRWGFKEIWGGNDFFRYEWELYLGAFPNAWFVHSVRHPFDYLRSVISHNLASDPTEDAAVYELRQWVAMVRHARSLRSTRRYFEFRMEDFDAELPRMLDALDLPPAPACTAAARFQYLPSPPRPISISANVVTRVDGLQALADELGYSLTIHAHAVSDT